MEDAPMPKPHDDLTTCLREAGKDAVKVAECQRKFEAAGGKTEGGKVFATPDGEVTVRTNGGKVFSGHL
jgi:hypothetical protein